MVSTELATFAPGVMDAGENEQLKSAGKPEHVSAIELLNAPDSGVTVTVIFPLAPAVSVKAKGFAPRVTVPLVLLLPVQFRVNLTGPDI